MDGFVQLSAEPWFVSVKIVTIFAALVLVSLLDFVLGDECTNIDRF